MNEDMLNRLPGEVSRSIPEGEIVCWVGRPYWISLGFNVFGIKYLLLYFIISAFYAISQIELVFSFRAFIGEYISFIISGIIASVILFLLAYFAAQHTCYVITEKRLVIRTGIALVFLLNVPLKNVISIDKQSLFRGYGNLSFKPQSKKRIPYSSCWPSVRGSSFLKPIPTFRSIANIEEIGRIVGEMAEKNREGKDLKGKAVSSGVAA